MNLYDQETELALLLQLFRQIDNKRAIDVGAERGGFVDALLEQGAASIHAIEPFPASAELLRNRFSSDNRVHVLEMALSDREGTATLHVVKDKNSGDNDSLHSIVPVEETPMLQSIGTVAVQCRTLESLLTAGAIPAEVGVLKIDAERSDFAVLRGIGTLKSAVIMIEFWNDLPQTVGKTPYSVSEVIQFMAARGYTNYVVIKRYDEFEVLQMNNSSTRSGEWGNVIFLHDAHFTHLSGVVYAALQAAQTTLVDRALLYRSECEKRLDVIEAQQVAINRYAANDPTLIKVLKRIKASFS